MQGRGGASLGWSLDGVYTSSALEKITWRDYFVLALSKQDQLFFFIILKFLQFIFLWILSSTYLFSGYGDMSAFKYVAFDNKRPWYIDDDDLRQIWLEAYEKHSSRLIACGAEGVDLASRMYDKMHPRDYDKIMLLLPWWDHEYIRQKRAKSRFGKDHVRFEITLAAIDGSIIAKVDSKGESVIWKTALKRAIDGAFDKLVYHYKGYDSSRLYSFPEFEKRFSGLEVFPNFGRQETIQYFANINSYQSIEGIWQSNNYFGRVPAQFAIFYIQSKDSYAIVNITEDLYGLKQGTVIGEFTHYKQNMYNGYFVDCLTGKYEVGIEFDTEAAEISQLTTRERQARSWSLTKVYTPTVKPRIASSGHNALNGDIPYPKLNYAGQGSGYQVPNSKIIFTNQHVVEGADFVTISFEGSNKEIEAEVLMEDAANDLAILRVSDGREERSKISIDISLDLGDKVRVFGYPDIENLGSSLKYTEGVVNSTIGLDKANWMQMNAEIYPGSSGGPVFNDRGDLMGISVAGMDDYANVNYAIKAAYLIALFEQYDVPYKIGESSSRSSISDMGKDVCVVRCYRGK